MERASASLARRQHGVVSRAQLADLGLSRDAIDGRVALGRLHVIHRGVYAVGHTVLTVRGHWLAAVLACGPGAALSHADGGVVGHPPQRRADHRRHGAAHGAHAPGDPHSPPAHAGELTDHPALDAMARAHPGHRGSGKLQRTLRRYSAGDELARSDLELLFKDLCRTYGLPLPRVNQPVAGKEVDVLFVEQRVIVEVDSWRYHKTRRAFEDDRARDVITTAAGYRTLRFTDRQLTRQPQQVANAIAAVLADRRAASQAPPGTAAGPVEPGVQ